MALSGKVALLTSLAFIFGMSCLVSQVAHPIVEQPTPLIVRGPGLPAGLSAGWAADVDSRRSPHGAALEVVGRFERSSALAGGPGQHQQEGEALIVAQASPLAYELAEPELPPLQVPAAPVVAWVEEPAEEPPALAGPGSPVMTMTSVPEAIVANVSSSGARLLAALRPEREAEETGDTVASAGPAAPALKQYKVRQGDSLVKIMRREWNRDDEDSLKVLLAANPQIAERCDRIYPGEMLNIPDPDAAPAASTIAQAGPAASGERVAIRWYTVRKRDSLAGIARRLLSDPERWREIAQLNQLRDAHKILPGMRIKLPLLQADT
jgi:nucleoid-associated protein YgaU